MARGGKRARSGRKPLPADIIDNKQAHRSKKEITTRLEAQEQLKAPTSAIKRCPTYLSEGAKKEWRRISKLYSTFDSGVLNDLDLQILVLYCEAVSVYSVAQKEWTEKEKVVGAVNGKTIVNPYIKVMNEQVRIIATLAEQLCLSPVGRARMGINAQPKKSKLAEFLGD